MYVLLQQHNPYCIKLTLHKVIALIDCLLYMITYILYVSDHLPKWPLRYILSKFLILGLGLIQYVPELWLFQSDFFLKFLFSWNFLSGFQSAVLQNKEWYVCAHTAGVLESCVLFHIASWKQTLMHFWNVILS